MLASNLMVSQTTVNAALNGWQQNDSTWNYYVNDSKSTGWISYEGSWYYLDSYGDMVTGWANCNGSWYYLHENGKMATGWVSYNGSWYFLNQNGVMESGKWISWQGRQYYLYSSGEAAVNTTTPDGYTVGYDGAWNGISKTTYSSQDDNISYIVYITRTGSKYHRAGCRYLSRSQIAISKSQAISQGYTPCSVCNP